MHCPWPKHIKIYEVYSKHATYMTKCKGEQNYSVSHDKSDKIMQLDP